MPHSVGAVFRQLGFCQKAMGFYLLYVLVCVVFVAPFVGFSNKPVFSLMNPLYFLVAALTGVGTAFLLSLLAQLGKGRPLCHRRIFRAVVGAGTFILLLVQLVILANSWFLTEWDVGILTAVDNVAWWEWYFEMYPNQHFLAGLFARLIELGNLIGFDDGYLFLTFVSCLNVSVSVALAALVGKRLGGFGVGYATFLLGSFFIGLSPWILVPYSDTYAMPWPTLFLWFLVCVDKRFLKVFGMTFAAAVGYFIKPTVVFVLVAAVCVYGARWIVAFVRDRAARAEGDVPRRPLGAKLRTVLLAACAVFLAAFLGLSLAHSVSDIGLDVDEEMAFTPTHYLMMGFNPEGGGYSGDDVDESFSHPTKQERQEANLRIWRQRVHDAGPLGVAGLLVRKTCTNYADGTMAWACEGGFWGSTPNADSFISKIYGIGEPFSEAPFAPIAQVTWFAILIGVTIACFSQQKRGNQVAVICLTLLFLSLFLMIFECRARYLILYLPCFVIFAALGWRQMARCVR